jgi:hypothetical protein
MTHGAVDDRIGVRYAEPHDAQATTPDREATTSHAAAVGDLRRVEPGIVLEVHLRALP